MHKAILAPLGVLSKTSTSVLSHKELVNSGSGSPIPGRRSQLWTCYRCMDSGHPRRSTQRWQLTFTVGGSLYANNAIYALCICMYRNYEVISKIRIRQSTYIYFKINRAKVHPDPFWMTEPRLFKNRIAPTRRTTTRRVAIRDQFPIQKCCICTTWKVVFVTPRYQLHHHHHPDVTYCFILATPLAQIPRVGVPPLNSGHSSQVVLTYSGRSSRLSTDIGYSNRSLQQCRTVWTIINCHLDYAVYVSQYTSVSARHSEVRAMVTVRFSNAIRNGGPDSVV